jgi:hypothetical protein
LKTKYTEDSKTARKMRYSAYYNLAVIYLLLDEPEKTIVEAEKLILNDYDKGRWKELINRANRLIEDFKIAKNNIRPNFKIIGYEKNYKISFNRALQY